MNIVGGLGAAASKLARGALDAGKQAPDVVRNYAEFAFTGGLVIEEVRSPYTIVAEDPMYRLRRYFPQEVPDGDEPPLVLIPPLLITADVYDVAPRSSPVANAHANGLDAWVVDFGRPEDEPGGRQRTIADHVLALDRMIDQVREVTGKDPMLCGYSQGGLFCYQVAAYRRGQGVDSIVALGAPVDYTLAPLPTPVVPVSAESYQTIAEGLVASGLLPHLTLPRWMCRLATKATDPVATLKFQLQYVARLRDRNAVLPGEQQRQFLDSTGYTVYPGPSLRDLMQIIAENRLLRGGLVVGDRAITLADITCPILTIIGERDREGAAPAARAIAKAAPRAPIYELTLGTGHFGMVASSGAARNTWPRVGAWGRWRAGVAELPDVIGPAAEVTSAKIWQPSPRNAQLQQLADRGITLTRSGVRTVSSLAAGAQALLAQNPLPVIDRLGPFRQRGLATPSSVVAERAARAPDAPAVIVGGVVTTNAGLNTQIDELVGRLISAGVHRGDTVGVLHSCVENAFRAILALTRLGANVTLLRHDLNLGEQLAAAPPAWLVVDTTDGVPNVDSSGLRILLYDEAPAARPRATTGVVDLALVKPTARPPDWYQPDPAAGFVTFAEQDSAIVASTLRATFWASVARGSASAADVTRSSTVHVGVPPAEPMVLAAAIGAALLADARLSFPSGPDSFWSDVRRAGATHLAMAGDSLQALLDPLPDPMELGQPIRCVVGPPVPDRQRREALDRLPDLTAVELLATTDGAGVVGWTSTQCRGPRRLRFESADLRLVRYDFDRGCLLLDPHGLARPCRPGELGVLVARAPEHDNGELVRHALFAPGDAWSVTDLVCWQGRDGEFSYAGGIGQLLASGSGHIAPRRIESAFGAVPCVECVVVRGGADGVTAEVRLRDGGELTQWDLDHAAAGLGACERPAVVRVLGRRSSASGRTRASRTTWVRGPDGGYQVQRKSTGGASPTR